MNLKKLCIIMIKRGCTHIFSAHTGNTQSLEILKTCTCEHVFHVLGTENTEKFLSLKRQKMCFYEEKIFKIFYTEQWKHVYAIFLSVLSTCFHWKHWALGAEKSKFVKRPFVVFRRKRHQKILHWKNTHSLAILKFILKTSVHPLLLMMFDMWRKIWNKI